MQLLNTENAKKGLLVKWYSHVECRWLIGIVTNTHRSVMNYKTGEWAWDKKAVEILLNGSEIIYDMEQNDEVYLLEDNDEKNN